jgi:formamidopyrimidine-DNA glycosylase
MPEMPEIAALAERMHARSAGETLRAIQPISFHALRSVADPAASVGHPIDRVHHRGKYVIVTTGPTRIVFSFAQGGRIEFEPVGKTARPRGGLARFTLDAFAWLFREWGTERSAGWWILQEGEDGPLEGLGPDCDDPAVATWIRTATDDRQLHTSLRDQRTIAGLGRGWTDDILHAARLSPFASLTSLDADAREALIAAIDTVLARAFALERARPDGLPPKLGDRFTIHNRAGTPCPACGADLRRVSFASREIAYCPTCQTGGKILADRRMSRLIR